jgi:acyl CoA:acetate/3-ketoacid CoA transferase alpha subunit
LDERIAGLLEARFAIPAEEGPSKLTSLSEAVKRYIKPGQTLHTAIAHTLSYPLCLEILRQFRGTNPGFTLATLGAVNHAVLMTHTGLLRKIVTSYCGDVYPYPSPNPVFQKAYAEKRVTIENWTVLTFTMRLLAGAMGLPGLPTRSLLGSGMEEENPEAFRRLEDPFGEGGPVGFLKPLRPDMTIMHAWAADRFGNALFAPPYAEGVWGAFAAREGVLLTAERIVSTDFIRRHAPQVRLPGYRVLGVVEAPFGAHPGGYANAGLPDMTGYAEDYDVLESFRKTCEDPKALDDWLERWVWSCRDHSDYLSRLGYERLMFLRGKADPDSWVYETDSLADQISLDAPPNPAERMTLAAAALVAEKAKDAGYPTILAGQGNSNLAAWMARFRLLREGEPVEVMTETGFFGYLPRSGNPFLFNFANIPTCKMLTGVLDSLGVMVSGAGGRCLGVLAAGQVDRRGSFNSTKVGDSFFIVGSGGANDVASTAREVVLVVPQTRIRYVERVPYVTGPGDRVTALVSDRGIFEKPPGKEDLRLTACFLFPDRSRDELVAEIRAHCGWNLRVASELREVPPPDSEDLRVLRLLDPRGNFIGSSTGK